VAVTSAVLDAALCLLFVSAAVVTVVDARNRADSPTPDRLAPDHAGRVSIQTLTTVTTTLVVRVPTPNRPETAERTRHGTLAELLAVGLADGSVRRAVRDAVARLLPRRTAVRVQSADSGTLTHDRTQSPPTGFRVGPRPPANSVGAASTTVPARGGDRVRLTVRWWQ
jgi:hypothetical protein